MAYTGSGIYAPNEGPVDVGRILELIHTPQGDGALVMMAHQAGKDDALKKIREGAPDAIIQIRRYVEDWTAETPRACASQFIDVMERLRPYTDHGTWGNEKDLAVESKGKVGAADNRLITWDEWRRIADYDYEVAHIVRAEAPWIVTHYPAVAYGHGEDWGYDRNHNVLPGFPVFPVQLGGEPDVAYNLLRPGIDLCHILNVHPYVQKGFPILHEWEGLGRLTRVKDLFPNKTLFAAETGDFDVTNPSAPQRIIQIAYNLQGDPAFLGYCFFILDSPDPAHDANNWSKNRDIEATFQRMTRTTRPRTWSQPVIDSKPPPAPAVAMPHGRAWWVWYIDACGGPQGIIDMCKATNAHAVYIKGGDGPHVWDQLTSQVVDQLADNGLDVYVWHYTYLGWIAGNVHKDEWKWTVDDELACVSDMVQTAGPRLRGFVSDAEAETEGRAAEAEIFAAGVRKIMGARFFGYAPLPVIDYHTALPFVQFNAYTNAVMPQFYSRNLDGDPPWTYERIVEQWDRWMAAWETANQPAPTLMPIGETYGAADPMSVREFEDLRTQREWPSWSYWSLQHAIQEGHIPTLETIANQEEPDDMAGIDLTPADRDELNAIFGDMWGKAERVNAILAAAYGGKGQRVGYWGEQGLKAAISQAKEPLGLND